MPKGEEVDISAIRKGIHEAGERTSETIGAQLRETLNMMYEAIKKGIQPKQMLKIGDETLEGIYTQAYLFYNKGDFKDAAYLFVILMMLDPMEPKYALGSGACLHRLGKYEKAAQVYLLSSSRDPQNPLPHFHAADCYIKLKALPLADMCLKNAINCCGDKKEYELIKERATLMLQAVSEELDAMMKESQESPS